MGGARYATYSVSFSADGYRQSVELLSATSGGAFFAFLTADDRLVDIGGVSVVGKTLVSFHDSKSGDASGNAPVTGGGSSVECPRSCFRDLKLVEWTTGDAVAHFETQAHGVRFWLRTTGTTTFHADASTFSGHNDASLQVSPETNASGHTVEFRAGGPTLILVYVSGGYRLLESAHDNSVWCSPAQPCGVDAEKPLKDPGTYHFVVVGDGRQGGIPSGVFVDAVSLRP